MPPASAPPDWPSASRPSLVHNDEPPLHATFTPPKSAASADNILRLRRRSSDNSASSTNSKSSKNRYSLPGPVPEIPAQFLALGKRAEVSPVARDAHKSLSIPRHSSAPRGRPSTSGGDSRTSTPRGADAAAATPRARPKSLPPPPPRRVHHDTLQKLEGGSGRRKSFTMSLEGRSKGEDLFLELANDQVDAGESRRPASRSARISSRASFYSAHRSLPAQDALEDAMEPRSSSSGYILGERTSSRLKERSADLPRRADGLRNTVIHPSTLASDEGSVSSRKMSVQARRFSPAQDRATSFAERLRSPALQQYGVRRTSFGAAPAGSSAGRPTRLSSNLRQAPSDSPAEDSERKQSLPDSTSADSQTEDKVWDELDDLKSRIKKLGLTGNLPPTSGAVVSAGQSDRPRSATTAPTTIDSSPKHETADEKTKARAVQASASTETAKAAAATGQIDIVTHPLLRSALAKAKTLLNSALYRSLEATAADALQLASVASNAGPHGTTFSAASVINNGTVSDRHVRRKADTMCRNLTDLCLALCEGKHEAPTLTSSPIVVDSSMVNSPSIRYPRASLGSSDRASRLQSRPVSRLEARRTSIFGSQAGSTFGDSPSFGSGAEDVSAFEQESTPSHLRPPDPRPLGRASSRLQAVRQRHYDDSGEDDDPTIRPPSRAMTDFGARGKPGGSPRLPGQKASNPSLRNSLATRRSNLASYETNSELSRPDSLSSSDMPRRRFVDRSSASPVLEEESAGDEYGLPVISSLPKRRVTSLGQRLGSRQLAMGSEMGSRAMSLGQRRNVLVE